MDSGGRRFVVAESRGEAAPGLMIAVLSLCRWTTRETPIEVSLGPELHHLGDRLLDLEPRLEVRHEDGEYSGSWNVKPLHLVRMLGAGADEAVWLDSDMVVTGPLGDLLDRYHGAFVATDDVWFAKAPDEDPRHAGWGWRRGGRVMTSVANSGLVKAEASHLPLLEDWAAMLADPRYVRAQSSDYEGRAHHLVGDQDVLTALLESDRHEDVDLVQLRRGTEVSQAYRGFGASTAERWHTRGRLPVVVHAMGPKPWAPTRKAAQRLERAVHPYTLAARPYRLALGDLGGWIPGRRTEPPTRPMYVGLVPSAIVALPLATRQVGGRLARHLTRARGPVDLLPG